MELRNRSEQSCVALLDPLSKGPQVTVTHKTVLSHVNSIEEPQDIRIWTAEEVMGQVQGSQARRKYALRQMGQTVFGQVQTVQGRQPLKNTLVESLQPIGAQRQR